MSGSDLHNTSCNQPEDTELLTTIYDLPEEVLLEVFSYLLLPDRKHVRLVNKQWNELCYSARFTKHETFCFNDLSKLDNLIISRPVINVKLEYVTITNAAHQLQFLREHGCRVKSLTIRYSSITDRVLYDIINYCPNVEHISLSYLRFWTFCGPRTNTKKAITKLESLIELKLGESISDYFTLDLLAIDAPKLKLFALSDCFKVDKNDPISIDTMSLIKRQSDKLETLCFSGYSFVNDSYLKSHTEMVGVQLTGLFIPKCSNVTDNLLFAIAKKFINLEKLDISENYQLGRNMDRSVFSNLNKLKLVSLNSTSITDQVLSAVAALGEIEGIDLNRCRSLTAEGISRAFGTKHEKMLDIRLNQNSCVTDEILSQILPQLPNLRSIDLSSCHNISSIGVSAITNNCKLLRFLSLEECFKITSLTFPDINGLKGLLYLNLSGCSLDADTFGKLKYLELQVINLIRMPFTVECLKSLLVNCPSLQYVEFRDLLKGLEHPSVKEHIARETGRKCPAFIIGNCNLCLLRMRSIFELSACHFYSYPCSKPPKRFIT